MNYIRARVLNMGCNICEGDGLFKFICSFSFLLYSVYPIISGFFVPFGGQLDITELLLTGSYNLKLIKVGYDFHFCASLTTYQNYFLILFYLC